MSLELKAISFTLVQYDPIGGLPAKILAYSSLTPIFLMVSYATLIVFRRDLATIVMLIGQLSNELINFTLKSLIKQDRPFPQKLGKGYGMPSSHAQFMGFFCCYGGLWLYYRIKFDNNIYKYIALIKVLLLSFTVAYSRIYLNYHTKLQVFLGFNLGVIFGLILYFGDFYSFVKNNFRPILHFFLVKDTSKFENVLKLEYAFYENLEAEGNKVKLN
ncbi:Dolichyldiphosphatase 1 [Lobulomyces angularis]|nr:Dolichyldiphosphatase 1 [Lobulomyces angularis]